MRSNLIKVVIQIAGQDTAKAWAFLVRHTPGTALPNRTFIVSEEAVHALRKAGIQFTEISREPGKPWEEGAVVGERI